MLLTVYDDRIELRPLPDAISLSLKGKKIGKITLKELEEESMVEQKEYSNQA